MDIPNTNSPPPPDTNRVPRAPDGNSPRAYDLTDGAEHQRLFRELRGYLSTCSQQHHGTDFDGRMHAADALKEILQRGFTLKF
jgi:hypothetical protein